MTGAPVQPYFLKRKLFWTHLTSPEDLKVYPSPDDPAGIAETVRLALEAGLAGCSVEDATGDQDIPIYAAGLAAERVQAGTLPVLPQT